MLTVGVEAVDAVLDFGEDATGGIQLNGSFGSLYHVSASQTKGRPMGQDMEEYRPLKTEGGCRLTRVSAIKQGED